MSLKILTFKFDKICRRQFKGDKIKRKIDTYDVCGCPSKRCANLLNVDKEFNKEFQSRLQFNGKQN